MDYIESYPVDALYCSGRTTSDYVSQAKIDMDKYIKQQLNIDMFNKWMEYIEKNKKENTNYQLGEPVYDVIVIQKEGYTELVYRLHATIFMSFDSKDSNLYYKYHITS